MIEIDYSPQNLKIGGQMLIRYVDQFKQGLWEALPDQAPLTVDLSQVKEVDLAGLQLLLSFLRSRQEIAPTTVKGMTKAFEKALTLTGLMDHYAVFTA